MIKINNQDIKKIRIEDKDISSVYIIKEHTPVKVWSKNEKA